VNFTEIAACYRRSYRSLSSSVLSSHVLACVSISVLLSSSPALSQSPQSSIAPGVETARSDASGPDTASGEPLPDRIPHTHASAVAWLPENTEHPPSADHPWRVAHPIVCALRLAADPARGREVVESWGIVPGAAR